MFHTKWHIPEELIPFAEACMIVICPNCETTFSMPDELYRPGRKARCSQCSFVFPLPPREEPAASPEPLPRPEPKPVSAHPKKNRLILAAILVICLAGIGYGSFMLYRAFTSSGPGPEMAAGKSDTTQPAGAARGEGDEQARKDYEERVRNIALENVYQFVLQNDKIGPIVVVQGEAVNRFSTPKEFIVLEARLFDAQKNVLAAKQQMGGVSLTVFQLQMLTEKEIQDALDNRIIILTYNANVPPDGRVPFFVVFPKVFPNMHSFEVRVVDARDARTEEEAAPR